MEEVRVACEAMATRFEAVLRGEEPARLRAAGEEALAEIGRIERLLSLFRPTSDIGRINAAAARYPVRVAAETFELLRRAAELHATTGGVFDVTVGPLMRCWGFRSGSPTAPSEAVLREARSRVGLSLVELDPRSRTVRFTREGVEVDLGALGKGFAIDAAARVLREAGVSSALMHGGTSTVCAIGALPDGEPWKVAIDRPDEPAEPLTVVPLLNEALSVSAVWGRAYLDGERLFGHVMDPRTGRPAERSALAAVVTDSATDADALSTALLTLGLDEHERVTDNFPSARVLLLARDRDGQGFVTARRGLHVLGPPHWTPHEIITGR